MLRYCTAGADGLRVEGGHDGHGTDRANQHSTELLLWVIESMFLCLTSHFRDPRLGPRQREGSHSDRQCNCNVCLLFTLHFPSALRHLLCCFIQSTCSMSAYTHVNLSRVVFFFT